MNIGKGPSSLALRTRQVRFYSAAREALAVLLDAQISYDRRILLIPAYVGWSPREGSGILDPVRASGIEYRFYQVTDELAPDIESLTALMRGVTRPVVLLVHYFGRRAARADQVRALAHAAGGYVIEDWAHGFLSEDVSSEVKGDAAIYSLHKMLPVADGGALVEFGSEQTHDFRGTRAELAQVLLEFDLPVIRDRRRRNFARMAEEMKKVAAGSEDVTLIWDRLNFNEIPQSFPVLVPPDLKDHLYHRLNSLGIGVTSLYHTLVRDISPIDFASSHDISRRILNLPVHQDLDMEDIPSIVETFKSELARAVSHE